LRANVISTTQISKSLIPFLIIVFLHINWLILFINSYL
jgi:hypothetical protein